MARRKHGRKKNEIFLLNGFFFGCHHHHRPSSSFQALLALSIKFMNFNEQNSRCTFSLLLDLAKKASEEIEKNSMSRA
jgi:hypothetical protein